MSDKSSPNLTFANQSGCAIVCVLMSDKRDLTLSNRCVLPARLLDVRFSRSGGPGGQKVNTAETKVDLRLDLEGCAAFWTEAQAARVQAALGSRIDADGWLFVVSSEHRTRLANVQAAHDRLERLPIAALQPQRARKKTRPTRGSKERRLKQKRRDADVKANRRPVRRDD